jgi:nucleotide-binding universal stress UspA family protein
MYSRILTALDGSKLSERILPCAQFFAERLRPSVELLEVIDSDSLMPPNVDPAQESMIAERKKNIEGYLRNIAGGFPGGLKIDCAVEVGLPAEVIIDRAAAVPATLIAMTTHGRSGVQRWLLGSIAEKVLHGTREHLLLVRGSEAASKTEQASFRSIIVPLDGSELAESVLPHATELAKKMNLEIVLVRIFNLPTTYYDEGYSADERLWELIRDEAQAYLDHKVKELKSQGLAGVTSVLQEGFAAERIIALAQETTGSLIAICTHGRSGVRSFVLGSIVDRVVRHSGDPVLVIRAPGAT